MEQLIEKIKGKLIVSCQALPDEPLHSSYIMSRMAYAAFKGGAGGIRANTVEDITEIKKVVDLPLIGIIKKVYDDTKVYITPTMAEVDALVTCGCDIIAIDATARYRHDGVTLDEYFGEVRKKYPNQPFMADCATYEDGMHAAEIGFDFIGTTMTGCTDETRGVAAPDINMIEKLVKNCNKPVIAEGGIWTKEQLRDVVNADVLATVIGSAITRPMEITKYFASVLK